MTSDSPRRMPASLTPTIEAWCSYVGPKVVLDALATVCEAASAKLGSKPAGTIAAINAGVIRQAMKAMIE